MKIFAPKLIFRDAVNWITSNTGLVFNASYPQWNSENDSIYYLTAENGELNWGCSRVTANMELKQFNSGAKQKLKELYPLYPKEQANPIINPELQSMYAENETLKSDLENCDVAIRNLQNKVKTLQKCERYAKIASDENETLKSDLEETREDNLKMVSEATGYIARIKELEAQVEGLNAENNYLKTQADIGRDCYVAELEKTIKELQEENHDLKDQINALHNHGAWSVKDHLSQNDNLKLQVKGLQNACKSKNSAIKDFSEQIAAQREKIDELICKCNHAKTGELAKDKIIKNLETAVNKREAENDLLTRQIEAIRLTHDTLTEYENAKASLIGLLDEEKEANRSLQKGINTLMISNDRYALQNTTLTNELNIKTRMINVLKEESKKLSTLAESI